MTNRRFQIRHLSFLGPNVEPAFITFGPGLNVLYGPSNTGKSFIVDCIDFMLGGKIPLRDIRQKSKYDRVSLGIETSVGEKFTLVRSISGGAFKVFEGLFHDTIPQGDGMPLAEQHNEKRDDNLSTFLLGKLGIGKRRVRKNKLGMTNSLSFRYLARLVIINEEEIIQQRSPLSDGTAVADTANASVFRYMLTGVDDSALADSYSPTIEEQTKSAQLELLATLIVDYKKKISQLAHTREDLAGQESRLSESLEEHGEYLSQAEFQYREVSGKRRDLMSRLEESDNRYSEIANLLERFTLLENHYNSDIERLRAIEEAGTLFSVLPTGICPLCGSDSPTHKHPDDSVDLVVSAAHVEIEKIQVLQTELEITIKTLLSEKKKLEKRLPKLNEELNFVSAQIAQITAPNLRKHRSKYKELADKKGEVREALGFYDTVKDLEERKVLLEGEDSEGTKSTISEELSTSTVDQFSTKVLTVLKQWKFPHIDRVHFDLKTKDLVINGSSRISFGKGFRAITQAAFTVGLLKFCMENDTPHPGFVILDSPLLSYREPEGEADDLRSTDLNSRFYADLADTPLTTQVIVVENIDPPSEVGSKQNMIRFTGNQTGRYGFFPAEAGAALQVTNAPSE